jgi:hypothetical protein
VSSRTGEPLRTWGLRGASVREFVRRIQELFDSQKTIATIGRQPGGFMAAAREAGGAHAHASRHDCPRQRHHAVAIVERGGDGIRRASCRRRGQFHQWLAGTVTSIVPEDTTYVP